MSTGLPFKMNTLFLYAYFYNQPPRSLRYRNKSLGRGVAEGAAPRWACSSDTNESDTNEPTIPYYIFFIKNIFFLSPPQAPIWDLSLYINT